MHASSLFIPLFSALRHILGIKRVEVFLIERFLCSSENIGESLIVHHLALTQEFYNVIDVGVVG